MVLTAFILGAVAVVISAIGVRETFRRLGLDVRETLLWFGLAEIPAPEVPRRNRALVEL